MEEITKEWMEKHYGNLSIENMPLGQSLIRPYKEKIEELERKIVRLKQEVEDITESSFYWYNRYIKLKEMENAKDK